MLQRMEEYTLERYAITVNDAKEEIKTWNEVCRFFAAVSVATGSTLEVNEILKIKSTHRAVTMCGMVKVGDRFGGYVVDYIVPGRIYNQLYLTREDAMHK